MIRSLWRSLGKSPWFDRPPKQDSGEEVARTRDEKTERTVERLEAEADAKMQTATGMRKVGAEETAQRLDKEVRDLKRRVSKLEGERELRRITEMADVFEGRE